MLPLPPGRQVSPGHGVHRYERHRPEQTHLYPFIEQYYPAFVDHMAAQGATLPEYVQREFDDYLKCGRLEYGFLRVRCTDCHQGAAGRVQLQAPGILPELQGAAYGRERGVAGG